MIEEAKIEFGGYILILISLKKKFNINIINNILIKFLIKNWYKFQFIHGFILFLLLSYMVWANEPNWIVPKLKRSRVRVRNFFSVSISQVELQTKNEMNLTSRNYSWTLNESNSSWKKSFCRTCWVKFSSCIDFYQVKLKQIRLNLTHFQPY
jgi:hypothetical protein